MKDAEPENPQRLVVCLIADEEVIERFPTCVRYLSVGLIDACADVILVVPEHARARTLVAGPVSVITHRRRHWAIRRWIRQHVIGAIRQKLEAYRKETAVIVHGLSLSAAPLAASVAAATGAELVLNTTSTTVLEDTELVRRLYKAHALIVPTEDLRQALQASAAPAVAPQVVPFGLAAESAPAAFGDPGHAPALIFAGALGADAGVDLLLRAARRVLRDHPGLAIFISGKGPAETELRHLASGLGISANVTFTGRLDRLRLAMRSADLFCMPAALPAFREEPVHALAAGLVLVAAEGTLCDGLVDGQNALLFPAGDEAALAVQIAHALQHPEASRTLAATGQAHARSRYSVSRMVAECLRIYRQLLQRGKTLPLAASR